MVNLQVFGQSLLTMEDNETSKGEKEHQNSASNIRRFMEENFNQEDPVRKTKLKMFLDIHAHSAQRDIFIFAPNTGQKDMVKVRNFPQILNEVSPYFNIESCKFANEQYKKNCARLAVIRDFGIFHSYTIESSCWGYSLNYSDDTV